MRGRYAVSIAPAVVRGLYGFSFECEHQIVSCVCLSSRVLITLRIICNLCVYSRVERRWQMLFSQHNFPATHPFAAFVIFFNYKIGLLHPHS